MERFKKKNIQQAVSALMEANDFIRKTAAGNPQKAEDLLTQCQDTAIKVGLILEQLDEGYVQIVRKLEDYCENIYQMSVHFSDENEYRKLSKETRKQLIRIQNDIAVQMPEDRKEVVFLPYKASMWDSLESVWKAADADGGCDAYVIPIPYFDKNPDGSFREMHYEGEQYPAYVPVTWYEDYDFAGRRPDMIFIHNAYDSHNYVTSVHPFFYSENLKQYTEQLIYIPYFLLNEIQPDNMKAVESIKHFCMLPGVVNADRVIVQSEAMRRIYINVMTELAGMNSRSIWEHKILGLGSPKVDKVLNTRTEDLEIPEKWEKIIRKPDGSRKKIIFYNTGITALLQHNERMLAKMRDVFRIFYENKEEIALLWRPHPLIESTLTSMRPQLWGEYRKIRDQYIAEGWGIYDDTADMDRAVILSDAYYGDGSSVVQLCKSAGKPVMIQDVTRDSAAVPLLQQWIDRKGFAGMAKMNHRFFFPQMSGNGLISCKEDFSGFIQEAEFKGEPKTEVNLFEAVIPVKEKMLYMIPARANAVYEYDVSQRLMKHYALDGADNENRIGGKFSGALVMEEKLILVPMVYHRMVIFDLAGHRMEYKDDCMNELRQQKITEEFGGRIWGRQSCEHDGDIYMLVAESDYIQKYRYQTGKSEFEKINMPEVRFDRLCSDGQYIWIVAETEACILKWNPKDNTRKVIRDFPEGFRAGAEYNFQKILDDGRYIWFYPYQANMVLRLNKADDTLENVSVLSKRLQPVPESSGYYYSVEQEGKQIYAVKADSGDMQMIDTDTLEVRDTPLKCFCNFTENDKNELLYYWIGVLCWEVVPLQEFVRIILDGTLPQNMQENGNGKQNMTAAEKIYYHLKE